MDMIDGVTLTPLKIIKVDTGGNVMHALKQHEDSFAGFGEAYFSTITNNTVRGWKKHTRMKLNIIVPIGVIRFVMYDGRPDSDTTGQMQEVILSPDAYQRLTVPPGVWMAFQGKSAGLNMLLNVASIPHDPTEAENLPLKNDTIPYYDFDR